METNPKVIAALCKVQSELKAPKDKRNNFGGYNYRSAESILEAVKPLLHEAVILISDEMVIVGDRIYVRATATFATADGSISTSALAREPLAKKGMDEAQVTGATSSYARKYALNGLLAIDDTKDADALNVNKEYTQPAAHQQTGIDANEAQRICADINSKNTQAELSAYWNNELMRNFPAATADQRIRDTFTARFNQVPKQ